MCTIASIIDGGLLSSVTALEMSVYHQPPSIIMDALYKNGTTI
jgi:hypothetical protein